MKLRIASFEDRLLKVLRRKSPNLNEIVFLMSFEGLQETVGPAEIGLSQRVAATLAAACDRKFGGTTNKAEYEQYGDLHHVVIISGLSEKQARLAGAEIAEVVAREATSGLANRHDISIRTMTPDMDGELAFRELTAPASDKVIDLTEARSSSGGAGLKALDFTFRPLLNVKSGIVSAYLCLPVLPAGDGSMASGYGVLPKDPDLTRLAHLDAVCLDRVVKIIAGEVVRPTHSLIVVPTHFRVIADKDRGEAFFRRCKLLSMDVRKRIIFEVVGIPASATQAYLEFVISSIKPYARQVIARTSLRQGDFDGLRGAGIYAVGLDLYELGADGNVDLSVLDQFAEAAERAGLHLFAHGVRSISLSTAAICAGFEYVGGHAVTETTSAPREPSPFDLKAPYKRLHNAA